LIDWGIIAAAATGVGALATGISMAFIAWQAWETRKAAGAASNSVSIAKESLLVSQMLALEAIRTRLDARAPRLRVVAVEAETSMCAAIETRQPARRETDGRLAKLPWQRINH
jgi:hypothetical protein